MLGPAAIRLSNSCIVWAEKERWLGIEIIKKGLMEEVDVRKETRAELNSWSERAMRMILGKRTLG